MFKFCKKNTKKILFAGGGTGGSVSPLLAVAQELGEEYEFFWLGTKNGPERKMVEGNKIKFKSILCGKLRRYFSILNFIDPFFIFFGFVQSFFIIIKWRPSLVMSAGSFVSVPVFFAAWILRVPILVHQQDVRPGLSNKIIAPFAQIITTTFEKSLKDYGKKSIWTGNPSMCKFFLKGIDKNAEYKKFNFKKNLPIVLVIGGGTGALALNQFVWQSINELTKFCQIIHIVGKGKLSGKEINNKNYRAFEFLKPKDITGALYIADIVISRCGLGLLTEIFYLNKLSILIPIPDSHQEDNAKIFKEKKAAIILNQKNITQKDFVRNINNIISDELLRSTLRNNIKTVMKHGANKAVAKIVKKIINQ